MSPKKSGDMTLSVDNQCVKYRHVSSHVIEKRFGDMMYVIDYQLLMVYNSSQVNKCNKYIWGYMNLYAILACLFYSTRFYIQICMSRICLLVT